MTQSTEIHKKRSRTIRIPAAMHSPRGLYITISPDSPFLGRFKASFDTPENVHRSYSSLGLWFFTLQWISE